ncbi:hypothetical protein QVD17_10691 [Tagetes erecta]|uniref:Uncharacterized protein n=1 Tax=Tagetes erecta TaxID=13708 RepID=A0AAD8P665_TARER|nr:hypothetical protein QVD17_10691 [Tagetes erecta]
MEKGKQKMSGAGVEEEEEEGGSGKRSDGDYSHLLAYLDEEYDHEKEILDLEFPCLCGLQKRIRANRYHQDFWFKELRKVWTGKESPVAASRLIVKVFDEVYEGHPHSGDVQVHAGQMVTMGLEYVTAVNVIIDTLASVWRSMILKTTSCKSNVTKNN